LALRRYPKSRTFPFLPPSRHRSADNAHLLLYTFLAGLGYPSGSSCAVLFSCLPVCFRANLASFAGFCYGPIRAHQQSKRRAARSNEDLDAETGAGKAAKRNKSRSKRDKLASTFRRKKSSKKDNETENIELRPLSSGRHDQSQPPHRHSQTGDSQHDNSNWPLTQGSAAAERRARRDPDHESRYSNRYDDAPSDVEEEGERRPFVAGGQSGHYFSNRPGQSESRKGKEVAMESSSSRHDRRLTSPLVEAEQASHLRLPGASSNEAVGRSSSHHHDSPRLADQSTSRTKDSPSHANSIHNNEPLLHRNSHSFSHPSSYPERPAPATPHLAHQGKHGHGGRRDQIDAPVLNESPHAVLARYQKLRREEYIAEQQRRGSQSSSGSDEYRMSGALQD
jgi:hypothetical protein